MKKIKVSRAIVNFLKEVHKTLKPPLKIGVAEWADNYRILSSESSAEPGRWNTSRTPYMKEIYDMAVKKGVRFIIVMAAAQMSKSELINNIIGRFIDIDPGPMLVVQPTDELAKSYSKDRIAPMIRDCPRLRKLVKDPNKKNSGNTISYKKFLGGFIAFVGTFRENKLASRPIRLLFCDEVDRYAKSAGNEGSPLDLAKKRITTFVRDGRGIITGTPTIKGASEIETEYLASSQGHWYLSCPVCEEHQTLKFRNLNWDKDPITEKITVKMLCEHCGALSYEHEWKKDNQVTGIWIHDFPERTDKMGYHLNALASPWRTWEDIVKEWIEVEESKDEQKKIVFINTVLAETYEEEVKEKIDWEHIFNRREKYNAEVPDQVLILTAGIDVQDKWIELEVVGWGLHGESWGILHLIIPGNPEQDEIWESLDGVLKRKFYYKNGKAITIYSSCIDTGGHHTERTYDFVSTRQSWMRIYGIKGQGGENIPVNNGFRRTKDNRIDLLSLGVNALKDITYGRLKIVQTGKGYCHFPDDIKKNYGINYFKALTAEVKKIKNRAVVWEKIRERNEALDIRNYATAALEIWNLDLNKLAEMSQEEREKKYGLKEMKGKRKSKKKVINKGVEI